MSEYRRRFPRPWAVHELDTCYVVRDASGFAISYHYFDDNVRRANEANLMSRSDARMIAGHVAKIGALEDADLPEPPRKEHLPD